MFIRLIRLIFEFNLLIVTVIWISSLQWQEPSARAQKLTKEYHHPNCECVRWDRYLLKRIDLYFISFFLFSCFDSELKCCRHLRLLLHVANFCPCSHFSLELQKKLFFCFFWEKNLNTFHSRCVSAQIEVLSQHTLSRQKRKRKSKSSLSLSLSVFIFLSLFHTHFYTFSV